VNLVLFTVSIFSYVAFNANIRAQNFISKIDYFLRIFHDILQTGPFFCFNKDEVHQIIVYHYKDCSSMVTVLILLHTLSLTVINI